MTPRRLRYKGLAAALENLAPMYDRTGLQLAQHGIPGGNANAMADALREAAGLLRSVGRSPTGAARMADVAAMRAQATGKARDAWELVRASIRFHLLGNEEMMLDPLRLGMEPPVSF